jgi:hypothetical protein
MSVRDDLKKNIIDFVKQIDQGCNKPVCLNYHCRKNPGKLTFPFPKKSKILILIDICDMTKAEALKYYLEQVK